MAAITASQSVTSSAAGGESRAKAWGMTALLVALYVVNWGGKTVLGLVAQDLKDEIGFNEEQIGLIASAFFVLFVLSGLGTGAINRVMSLRWSLTALVIGWSLAMLPVVMSATFTVLLLSPIPRIARGSVIFTHTCSRIFVAPAREARSAVCGAHHVRVDRENRDRPRACHYRPHIRVACRVPLTGRYGPGLVGVLAANMESGSLRW